MSPQSSGANTTVVFNLNPRHLKRSLLCRIVAEHLETRFVLKCGTFESGLVERAGAPADIVGDQLLHDFMPGWHRRAKQVSTNGFRIPRSAF
jgi:hypothetical protein